MIIEEKSRQERWWKTQDKTDNETEKITNRQRTEEKERLKRQEEKKEKTRQFDS